VSTAIYDHRQHALIGRLWRDPRVTWVVACYPEDTYFVYGFAVMEATQEGPILHYSYVRADDRRLGVMGLMLDSLEPDPKARWWYTHSTPQFRRVLATSSRFTSERFEYDPYLLSDRDALREER
jgi:hypothetical protein